MNANEFAQKYGRGYRNKIANFYEMGYLGDAERDNRTGEYHIPDDVPVPYLADPRIKHISKIWKEILKAAELGQSIFSNMYPKVSTEVFNQQLEYLSELGFIKTNYTFKGYRYLTITIEGMNFLKNDNYEKNINKILKMLKAGVYIVEVVAAISNLIPK